VIEKNIAVIGGGAAGYFSAIAAASNNPHSKVTIFEGAKKPLTKVLVSGGGRCNVTHHCFEISELIKNYPRGSKELRGAFSRFQVTDTIAWFKSKGVELKAEADGRMFPVTDSSTTIASCLQKMASDNGIQVKLLTKVARIECDRDNALPFLLVMKDETHERFSSVILASGGNRQGFDLAAALGHTIIAPVPSLFTFKINDSRLKELSGISFSNVSMTLVLENGEKYQQQGALLITHWGLSGPGIIKLSALAARELFQQNYQAKLMINFSPQDSQDSLLATLLEQKKLTPKKELKAIPVRSIPKRYWQNLIAELGLTAITWADVSKKQLRELSQQLHAATFAIQGKGVFKEEFVTCGGVNLKEVDFRNMQSRVCPGLFFAGEVLNIDGLTGGFNFQAAWTTGWIAGSNI